MNLIADFTLVPVGSGISLSRYVARCQEVLAAQPVTCRLHANGTGIEGEWDAVMAAVKACHEAVHEMGSPRIFSTLHLGTRIDREQGMEDKLASVRKVLDS